MCAAGRPAALPASAGRSCPLPATARPRPRRCSAGFVTGRAVVVAGLAASRRRSRSGGRAMSTRRWATCSRRQHPAGAVASDVSTSPPAMPGARRSRRTSPRPPVSARRGPRRRAGAESACSARPARSPVQRTVCARRSAVQVGKPVGVNRTWPLPIARHAARLAERDRQLDERAVGRSGGATARLSWLLIVISVRGRQRAVFVATDDVGLGRRTARPAARVGTPPTLSAEHARLAARRRAAPSAAPTA